MIWIGIDTGTHTGIAAWDSNRRMFVQISTMKIHQALKAVYDLSCGQKVKVVVEDPRQRKWLPHERSLRELKGRAMGAGSVKRDASIWEDFCSDYGIPCEMRPPQKGQTKWSEEYFKSVTGWTGRTSNHARDAALLVFGR